MKGGVLGTAVCFLSRGVCIDPSPCTGTAVYPFFFYLSKVSIVGFLTAAHTYPVYLEAYCSQVIRTMYHNHGYPRTPITNT